MRHLIFPSSEAATAFITDLQTLEVAGPLTGQAQVRQAHVEGAPLSPALPEVPVVDAHAAALHSPENVAEGAVTGGVAGMAAGGVVGLVAAATVLVATGGLALPVVLGMAALGSGVGAAVGAVGAAAGVDETRTIAEYQVHPEHFSALETAAPEGRAVAVEDTVPEAALREVALRHGGEYVV